MTATAVITMILTIVLVFGGFIASIVRLQLISKKQTQEEENS